MYLITSRTKTDKGLLEKVPPVVRQSVMPKLKTTKTSSPTASCAAPRSSANSEAMLEEAERQLVAFTRRLDADLMLLRFAEMWVQTFITVIQLNPPQAQPFAV